MRRRILTIVFLGWAVLYSRHGDEWRQVGEQDSPSGCEQIRSALVAQEAMQEMDGALASQPADNPLRQKAYEREVRNVDGRYRCQQH